MQEPSRDRSTGISANLQQILALILDKGLVIDLAPRLSLGGVEILSLGARVVIASAGTFLQHAPRIARIGKPHRWNGTRASTPTTKRIRAQKHRCRRSSPAPAALPRKRRGRNNDRPKRLEKGSGSDRAALLA